MEGVVDVVHPKLGRGRVVATVFRGDDPMLDVDFAALGRKKLLARFCRGLDGYPLALRCREPLSVGGVPLPSLAPLYPDGRYGVTCTTLPVGVAAATWRALADGAGDTRTWPVLLGDGAAVELPDQAPREAIQDSAPLAIEDLLFDDGDPDLAEELFDRTDPMAGDPDFFHPSHPAGPRAAMALVQVDAAWKVVAYLPAFEGPSAAERAALARYYSARYRPRLYRVGATLEWWVERRPQSWHEARDLAEEHLRFCPPLLDDDRTSLEKYTAHLLETHLWVFAW